MFDIRVALSAEKLGRWLEYCRRLKNALGKLEVEVNSIPVLNERTLVRVEICVLSGWKFSSQSDIVSETPYNSDRVGRELCPKTDWKIRVGKIGFAFILKLMLKSDAAIFHSWHQSVTTTISRLRIFLHVIFSKNVNLRNYSSWSVTWRFVWPVKNHNIIFPNHENKQVTLS